MRRIDSRALRAASRARLAVIALSKIVRATTGFSSRNCISRSETMLSTSVLISLLPSFAFVWPSNCAFVSLTEMTQVRPSRQSSPLTLSPSLMMPFLMP